MCKTIGLIRSSAEPRPGWAGNAPTSADLPLHSVVSSTAVVRLNMVQRLLLTEIFRCFVRRATVRTAMLIARGSVAALPPVLLDAACHGIRPAL